MIEYRVCWNASSNITFHGSSDWYECPNNESAEEIQDMMSDPDGGGTIMLPRGLEEALEVSGFDWWIETREDLA